MTNACYSLPNGYNEPICPYAPGSAERAALKAELERQANQTIEIPVIIGGKEYRTGNIKNCVSPHDHGRVLAKYHEAGESEIRVAAETALKAKKEWERCPWEERAAIFHRAASLISTRHRYLINASTMLGQSKTAFQAEIDAVCETVDFIRFNLKFMEQIYRIQPGSEHHVWNRQQYRALEGFVLAVSPFNFTAIGANLALAPALMGNVVLWKPASTAVLSNYYLMQIYKEAGLPDGVINFIPGKGSQIGKILLDHPSFTGLHFTGSTNVFNNMWKTVGDNLGKYKTYPRLVGETGGKDFIFMHPTGDAKEVAINAVRAAFEYQGQKCSACSRLYIPSSKWSEVKTMMLEMVKDIKVGDVRDFRNFMGAVIDEASFDNAMRYIETAKSSKDAEILCGGIGDKSKGFFVQPTIIQAKTPKFITMEEEIFAPVLSVYVYEDAALEETLRLVDETSPYALTGAIFAKDRYAIIHMMDKLANAAGNFYINDKCTGAVVGQQPFGGARASGTNDKAGGILNLLRWTSARTIKENFVAPSDFRYPFMAEE